MNRYTFDNNGMSLNQFKSLVGSIVFPVITVALLLALFLLYRPLPAESGGNFVVNSTADTDDGVCNPANCTLREAIRAANNAGMPATIVFSLPSNSTITLAGTYLPPVTGNVTIDGSTAVNLTISGNGTSRILIIGPDPFDYPPPMPTPTPSYPGPNEAPGGWGALGGGTVVTLTKLTIRNGSEPLNQGGAIYNGETLVIQNSTISDSESKFGAIFNEGSLTIVNSVIVDNEVVTAGGAGAGIYNEIGSALSIMGTTVRSNSLVPGGAGGALYNNRGVVNIVDSVFELNSASSGAAIFHDGFYTLSIIDSTIRNNQGGPALEAEGRINVTNSSFNGNTGGAMYLVNIATIDSSTFSGNSSPSNGGAINVGPYITVNISNSFFGNNSAATGGGAIYSIGNLNVLGSTFTNNSSLTSGGAIAQSNLRVTIEDTTFNGNTAVNGGAILVQSPAGTSTINNSTISGNSAQNRGGGLYASGNVTLKNVTISGNGAISGGGLYNNQTLNFSNSILANSPSGGDCFNSGTIGTNINNLVENGSCGAAFSGDPVLSPLQDNGGLTLTHYPQLGSPVIDTGDDVSCEPVDQRGLPRPLDGDEDGITGCDIGAVERGHLFVVNRITDPAFSICTLSSCALRAAIHSANSSVGTDVIRFNIPGTGPHTISPLSALPAITSPVIIDGFSQPGAMENTIPGQPGGSAIMKIVIDGTSAGPLASGLTIADFNSVIRGLVVHSFSQNGIQIKGSGATGNVVAGNFIGTGVISTVGPGNGGANVFIGSGASNNMIGGEAAEDGNIIAFAGTSGVIVVSDEATGNVIRSNAVYSNGMLGIDLGGDGLTVNDVGDGDIGPNGLQNYPEVMTATADFGSTHITGTLNSAPLTTFTLEAFTNTACDNSGYGEGKRSLGLAEVSTDNAGQVDFVVSVPAEAGTNEYVSVTATDPGGNTSEFAGCVQSVDAPIRGLTVTNSSPTPLNYPTFFQVDLTSGGNVKYSWDFGDGSGGSGRLPSHNYPDVGYYTAVVTATNSINMMTGTTNVLVYMPIPTNVVGTAFGSAESGAGFMMWVGGFVVGLVAVGVWFYGRRRPER